MLEIMRKGSGALHRTINEKGEMRYESPRKSIFKGR
jgi:stalled ribosome alternative rescue factor ArfA